MSDLLDNEEELASGGLDFGRIPIVLRRHYFVVLGCVFLGWAAIWGSSWLLPAEYKSTTSILIEKPTVPTSYVQPNVTEDIEGRMQSFTQQILSRSRLESIIDTLGLYRTANGGRMSIDDKVAQMRKDIDIQLIQAENGRDIKGFAISFKSDNPRVARAVVSDLSDLYITENLHAQEQASENTTSFITRQLSDVQTNLQQQEAKIEQYEAQHVGELPSQQQTNLQILTQLQSQLQSEEDALNTAKQQGIYLETLLSQIQTLSGGSVTVNGQPAGLAAIDQRLETLRAKLSDLRSGHTELYPDVQAVEGEISKTEALRTNLLRNLNKASTSGKKPAQDPGNLDSASGMTIAQLEGQVKSNRAEQANRERDITDLTKRIQDAQARLDAEPANEQELANLTSGYEQLKQTYDDLLKKKNESAIATNMELAEQGEHFSVLDPPNLPSRPDFPNRLKFCGIGVGAGCGLAALVTLLMAFLDDRLYMEKEISELLPMGILSEIPEVILAADKQMLKRRTTLSWAATGMVFACILSGLAFSYFHG